MELEALQYDLLVPYNNTSGVVRPQQFMGQSQNYQQAIKGDNDKKKGKKNNAKELLAKKKAVEKYMDYYDDLMRTTIRKNNDSIYQELFQFLRPSETLFMDQEEVGLTVTGVGGQGFQGYKMGMAGLLDSDSQVPTCLVITSNESSSSIDTQFGALCTELSNSLQAINLVLDEKKCINMKSTIEHIQMKLCEALGISLGTQFYKNEGIDAPIAGNESGDEVMLKIPQNDSDSDAEPIVSSNHVSTLIEPSFCLDESSRNQKAKLEILNNTVDVPMEGPMEPELEKKRNYEKIVQTRSQKQKDQNQTGSQIIKNSQMFKKDEYESNLAKIMEEQQIQSDIIKNETFYGIKQILEKNDIDTHDRPILLIIKNIKSFDISVLNDLIHHLKIYRGYPHFLNLNLMLGVQNNCKEEIHLRVSIQNCVKLAIKTFYFPSMKNIIFEVVFKMLLTTKNILMFEPKVICSLIETINLFGMSVEKFKRIIKVLIAEHIYKIQDFYFLHKLQIQLCSKKSFVKEYVPQLTKLVSQNLEGIAVDEKKQNIDWVLLEINNFVIKRRHWHKAFEVLQELVCKAYKTIEKNELRKRLEQQHGVIKNPQNESDNALREKKMKLIEEELENFRISDKELNIFKYQFVLNYLSKNTNKDKMMFLKKLYAVNPNFSETIFKELLPTLKERKQKQKVENDNEQVIRTSKFIQTELDLITKMLTGEYTFLELEKNDRKNNQKYQSIIKMNQSASRHEQLLGGGSKANIQKQQDQVDLNIKQAFGSPTKKDEDRRLEIYKQLRPKDEVGYTNMFWTWIEQFHEKYLGTEKLGNLAKTTYLIGHNAYEAKINADVGGQMTRSLMESQKILGVQSNQEKTRKLDAKELDIEQISYQEENTAILMEICKFYGRDINIMEMYGLFENILKKGDLAQNEENEKSSEKSGEKSELEKYSFTKDEIRMMFLQALRELKYMGYLSQTKVSTFIFKKNYYGKAKHQKSVIKNEQQKERDKLDACRQYGLNI